MSTLEIVLLIIVVLFALGYKVYQYINFFNMAEASDQKEKQKAET